MNIIWKAIQCPFSSNCLKKLTFSSNSFRLSAQIWTCLVRSINCTAGNVQIELFILHKHESVFCWPGTLWASTVPLWTNIIRLLHHKFSICSLKSLFFRVVGMLEMYELIQDLRWLRGAAGRRTWWPNGAERLKICFKSLHKHQDVAILAMQISIFGGCWRGCENCTYVSFLKFRKKCIWEIRENSTTSSLKKCTTPSHHKFYADICNFITQIGFSIESSNWNDRNKGNTIS